MYTRVEEEKNLLEHMFVERRFMYICDIKATLVVWKFTGVVKQESFGGISGRFPLLSKLI